MAERKDRGGPPERLADMLGRYLRSSGLGDRVKQMEVLTHWEELVGSDLSQVTRPISVSQDGTLYAAARSSAWMHELTLMEADLLLAINRITGARPVQRIRWSLMR